MHRSTAATGSTHSTLRHIGLAVATLLLAGVAVAGAQIPDKFTNLQVLPKEISKGDLVQTMKGFTRGLGVRCEHCHSYRAGVDPAAAEFSDFDFASDSREAKVKARDMIKMVRAINTDYIGKLTGGSSIQVRCITCHHGVVEPETIDDRMERKVKEEGVDAAIADYRELRGDYLQAGAYNFEDGPLDSLGDRLLKSGKAPEAKAILALNAEFHADSAWTQFLLGEALLATGDRAGAKAAYTKSLELDSDNPDARKRLEELSAPEPKPQG